MLVHGEILKEKELQRFSHDRCEVCKAARSAKARKSVCHEQNEE